VWYGTAAAICLTKDVFDPHSKTILASVAATSPLGDEWLQLMRSACRPAKTRIVTFVGQKFLVTPRRSHLHLRWAYARAYALR